MSYKNEKPVLILYIEGLRVFAMLSVVFLHVTSTAWFYVEKQTSPWYIYNALRCTTKWGVTVFVMISGMLLLDTQKEISIKKLYFKYIKRMVLLLVTWSLAYAIEPVVMSVIKNNFANTDFRNVVESFILGHQHLWYLYMMIGLYMVFPFIKVISDNTARLRYFILLSTLFTILFPIIYELKSNLNYKLLGDFLNKLSVEMVTGYSLYFVLGYYWSVTDIKKPKRVALYTLAFITFVFSCYLTAKSGGRHYLVDGTMSIGNFIITNAIFIFGKYGLANILEKRKFLTNIIEMLSSLSLGIYLIHMFFVKPVTKFVINFIDKPVIVTGITFLIVLSFSGILISIMKKLSLTRNII